VRTCPRCGILLANARFGRDASQPSGLTTYCRDCRTYKNKTEAAKEAASRAVRRHRLKTLFDLTPEEYEIMLAAQGGVCAICTRPPKTKRLAVDHNHKTGEVRGLLCARCNQILGNRAVVWLHAAIVYLENPPVLAALGRIPQGVTGPARNSRRRRKRHAN
jgi:hypothetical protein